MLLCPLCCIFKARNPRWYYSNIESSGFSDQSGSCVFKENVTQGRADIVDLGNRFEGISSTAANAGDAESTARKIAGSTDMKGNVHPGSIFQHSSVLRFLSNNL